MEDQQIKFGVEATESVRRALKVRAAQLGIKLKDAYQLAFEAWIARGAQPQLYDRFDEIVRLAGSDNAALTLLGHKLDGLIADFTKKTPSTARRLAK